MEMSDKYIIWLDSAIPLSGEKKKIPPNRVNTEMEGFFPLYNIFENKKKTRISYAEYEVERMEIEKES